MDNTSTNGQYKHEFIKLLFDYRALGIGGPFTLKSGRQSPYFVNLGKIDGNKGLMNLGKAYAEVLIKHGIQEDDIVYGIPTKARPIMHAAAFVLAASNIGVYWFEIRETEKNYGEGTKQASAINGHNPLPNERLWLIDDVLTTGKTKYDALDKIKQIQPKLKIPGLVIAVDRQEIETNGTNAVQEFTDKTGIPVFSIVNAVEIYEYLKQLHDELLIKSDETSEIRKYLMQHGTDAAKEALLNM